jgi:hypothetical protein
MKCVAAFALAVLLLCGCSSHPIRTYTETELADQVETLQGYQRDAILTQFPDAVLPEVEFVRFVTWDEFPDVIQSCLANQGWQMTTSPDGTISFGYEDSETAAFWVADYVCEARYPVDPRLSLPLNLDQQGYLYAYYIQVLKPCLELFGYAPPSPAPTLAEYLDTYESVSWNPYGIATTSDWETMSRNCPAEPAGLYGPS